MLWSARERSPMVTCSPVETTTSYSRFPTGPSKACLARFIKRSVSPDMADTTTITSWPAFFVLATLLATFFILSTEPTEVPPYFWTMRDMLNLPLPAYFMYRHAVNIFRGLVNYLRQGRMGMYGIGYVLQLTARPYDYS